MVPSSKSLDKLNMTPQEAYTVLQLLIETQKTKLVDVQLALSTVKRHQMEKTTKANKTKKGGLFASLRRAPNNNDLTGTTSNNNNSSEKSSSSFAPNSPKQPPKARQKVQAQRVDILSGSKSITIPSYDKTDESIVFLTKALSSDSNFLFSSLSPDELRLLIGAMAPHPAKADSIIIQQGDIGDYFYVLESGRVDFVVDGNLVGHCGPGASFGELALLYDSPRRATCKANDDCQLWRVDQHTFHYMLAKTQANQNSHIHSILRKVPFLSELEDQALSKIIDALVTRKFKAGDEIFRKGQVGDMFYILDQGTARIHDIGFGDTKFDDVDLGTGAYFGERALLTGEPRAAHVTATSDCVCLTLSRESFEATLGSLQQLMDRAMTKRVLVSIPSFGSEYIDNHELDQILDSMKEVRYKKGDIIMEEGAPVKAALHIIRKGNVTVVSGKAEINNLTNGGHFGESTLTMKSTDLAQATVSAIDDVVCNVLTKADIEKVIGSTSRLGQARALINILERREYIKYDQLTKLRILGIGTFGKVWLAVDKTTNKAFALKLMNKKQCIEYGQHEGVIRERNILANIDHPFLLKMWGSYQDDTQLMMLIDLIQGGELFTVLHTDKRDGVSNADAVFYASCVLEGLGHLHERAIVYRDLKPENALIDATGYCIVVDYGFAKVVTNKTFTLCGTPEYLAPEIILSKGHNKGVDYWAFGVLIYEMLVGRSPFYDQDQMRLFKKIVQVKYSYPERRAVSKAAEDLIASLLQRKQSNRLGNLKGGHVDVQKHPWFNEMDLAKLLKRELEAPWKPKITDALDASNFEDYSSMERNEEDTGPKLNSKAQALFKDFGEYV